MYQLNIYGSHNVNKVLYISLPFIILNMSSTYCVIGIWFITDGPSGTALTRSSIFDDRTRFDLIIILIRSVRACEPWRALSRWCDLVLIICQNDLQIEEQVASFSLPSSFLHSCFTPRSPRLVVAPKRAAAAVSWTLCHR